MNETQKEKWKRRQWARLPENECFAPLHSPAIYQYVKFLWSVMSFECWNAVLKHVVPPSFIHPVPSEPSCVTDEWINRQTNEQPNQCHHRGQKQEQTSQTKCSQRLNFTYIRPCHIGCYMLRSACARAAPLSCCRQLMATQAGSALLCLAACSA